MGDIPIRDGKVPDKLQLPTLIWILGLFFTSITSKFLFYIRACLGTTLLLILAIIRLKENIKTNKKNTNRKS